MLPHDWALWLFQKLERLEDAGSHWQGVLPSDLDFDEVVDALPEKLKGHCDADRRTIEFHPAAADVFESMNGLVDGARRRQAPKLFTVRDLNYTHGRSASVPGVVTQYLDAVRLWQLFDRVADHGTGQGHSLYFIKTFESKIELRCEYSAIDLCQLDGLDGENTENGKNRTLRLWHVRRSRAVLGLSVAVSGWSTAQPGVRRSGERASE